MNRIITLIPSLIIYGLGLACFFFLDIYISTNFDDKFISQWAFYKSGIFILGGFCILGFDQVMVRVPDLHFFIKKKFLIQSLFISIIGTGIVYLFYPIENLFLLFINLNLFSLVIFLSGIFRANQKFTLAQLATNGWKIAITIFFFVFFTKNIQYLYASSLSLLLLVLIVFYFLIYRKRPQLKEPLNYKDYRHTGIAFFFT